MPKLKTITGDISYRTEGGYITNLVWGGDYEGDAGHDDINKCILEYFAGGLKTFNVKLKANGTAFQQKVWQALLEIPYGTLVTYKDIAEKVGSHPRAVGGAIGKNPIPIIIPCHRVVGRDGNLTGFSGGDGISTKEILIKHEQQNKS